MASFFSLHNPEMNKDILNNYDWDSHKIIHPNILSHCRSPTFRNVLLQHLKLQSTSNTTQVLLICWSLAMSLSAVTMLVKYSYYSWNKVVRNTLNASDPWSRMYFQWGNGPPLDFQGDKERDVSEIRPQDRSKLRAVSKSTGGFLSTGTI